MQLYADDDFFFPVVEELRSPGHHVVTAQDDGYRARPDPEILARAHALGRVVLTHNRRHFERLHHQGLPHSRILPQRKTMTMRPWPPGSTRPWQAPRRAAGISASTNCLEPLYFASSNRWTATSKWSARRG